MNPAGSLIKLEDLPNIGIVLADLLRLAGIRTPDDLYAAGSLNAFTRIKSLDPEACFSKLCALEGAVEGIRWHNLPEDKKAVLRQIYKMDKK